MTDAPSRAIPGYLEKYILECYKPAMAFDPGFYDKIVNEKIPFLGERSIRETLTAPGGEEKVIGLFHRLEKLWGAPYHLAPELKTVPRSGVQVFKVKNRRSYAAICLDNLCEGATPEEAVRRLFHPLRRMGYRLSDD